MPSLVELEGDSEEDLRAVATKLGFDWSTVEFHDNRWTMENKYGIPVTSYKYFTFNKIE